MRPRMRVSPPPECRKLGHVDQPLKECLGGIGRRPWQLQHEDHDSECKVLGSLTLLRGRPHALLPVTAACGSKPVPDEDAKGPGEVFIWFQIMQCGHGKKRTSNISNSYQALITAKICYV